jgi:hypothetical protein
VGEGFYSFPGRLEDNDVKFAASCGQTVFAVDLNITYSFVDVLSLGPPTCAFHATDLGEAHCSGDLLPSELPVSIRGVHSNEAGPATKHSWHRDSDRFPVSNTFNDMRHSMEYESVRLCESGILPISIELDGMESSGEYASRLCCDSASLTSSNQVDRMKYSGQYESVRSFGSATVALSNQCFELRDSRTYDSRPYCDSGGMTFTKQFDGLQHSGPYASIPYCDSMGLTFTRRANEKNSSGQYDSKPYHDSDSLRVSMEFDKMMDSVGHESEQYCKSASLLWSNGLDRMENSGGYESARYSVSVRFATSIQGMISVIRRSVELHTFVLSVTSLFGSSESCLPELDAAQASQTQGTKVVWTILGVVVAVSIMIVAAILLVRVNRIRASSTPMSRTESELDVAGEES